MSCTCLYLISFSTPHVIRVGKLNLWVIDGLVRVMWWGGTRTISHRTCQWRSRGSTSGVFKEQKIRSELIFILWVCSLSTSQLLAPKSMKTWMLMIKVDVSEMYTYLEGVIFVTRGYYFVARKRSGRWVRDKYKSVFSHNREEKVLICHRGSDWKNS